MTILETCVSKLTLRDNISFFYFSETATEHARQQTKKLGR